MNRATAVVSVIIANIILVVPSAANDDGPSGWRISFNYITEGQGTVEWQSGIEPNIVTHREHRSFFGDFGGTYLIAADGTVIRGNSSGSENDLWMVQNENWLCGVGDNLQKVSDEIGTQSSTSLTGPNSGEQILVYLGPDIDTGVHNVVADILVWAQGTHTWWVDSYDPGWCTPLYSSGTESFGGCATCDSFRTLRATATDETNLTFTSSGSEHAGCAITDHAFADQRCLGPITRTWSVTAERFAAPSIHGIELTQAIQVYQTVEDLQAHLEKNNGDPPIPIVANKPLAIRVALEKPAETLKATIEASWNGMSLGTEQLTQPAGCAPPNTETVDATSSSLDAMDDCETADFIVGSRLEDGNQPLVNTGKNQLVVKLYSDDPVIGVELLNEYELTINAYQSDAVMLGAVNVCAERIGDRWQCLATPVRDLRDGTVLMSKIYPTDEVAVVPTGHQVRLEVIENADTPNPDFNPNGTPDEWDCYDSRGRRILNGTKKADIEKVDIVDFLRGPALMCEKDIWWYVALGRINRLYTITDTWLHEAGIRKFYYGLVKPNPLLKWGGMAWAVGEGRAAIGHAAGSDGSYVVDRAWVRDTVPHEIGHLLDLHDIQSDKDSEYKIAQDCAAWDPTGAVAPPWLYLYSAEGFVIKREVPFDVTRSKAIPPYKRHDVMGYCPGRVWASPYTYEHLAMELRSSDNDGAAAQKAIDAVSDTVESPAQSVGVLGKYWLVSGFMDEDSTFLDTIMVFETAGPTGVGTGSHELDVLDQAGVVLFTRKFSPATAVPKSTIPVNGLPDLPLSFVQLIPVQSSAAKIVIRNSTGSILVEAPLGGIEPQITMVFPVGGEHLSGEQTLMWTASDADSDLSELVYWVQYSVDAGNNWMTIGADIQDTSIVVNFDDLPGSSGAAVVRILASDHANTGSVTSGAFTVGKKNPTADIVSPEIGDVISVGGPVFFEGYGYDMDDGLIPSDSNRWSSDRDGEIGIGYKVSSSTLSEGQHRIRLSVNDSDSNSAFTEVQIIVGDFADEDGDGVPDDFDQCPGTPAGEEVNSDGCSSNQLDDDGDGVSNLDDQCPVTPSGEAVDDDGCSASERDSDGDGVSDANDQCPGTPSGTAVDNNGCATSQPTPSASSGGGGGGLSFAWVFFLWYWALLQSRHGVRLEIAAVRIP